MNVTKYKTRLHALGRHALMSIFTKEERFKKFVKGLISPLHLSIKHLLTISATFQEVIDYAKSIEYICHNAYKGNDKRFVNMVVSAVHHLGQGILGKRSRLTN